MSVENVKLALGVPRCATCGRILVNATDGKGACPVDGDTRAIMPGEDEAAPARSSSKRSGRGR